MGIWKFEHDFVWNLFRWGVSIDSGEAKNNKPINRWTIPQQFQAMKYSEVCPQSVCNFILKKYLSKAVILRKALLELHFTFWAHLKLDISGN
jgi:hypothetical protein